MVPQPVLGARHAGADADDGQVLRRRRPAFLAPRQFGKKCVERMVYELFNENSGVCRFHRKWAEVIVDEIISSHYHFPVNYKAHQFELAKQIYELDGGVVAPWESERTVDAVWKYLEDIGGAKPDADLAAWIERFRAQQVGRGPA